MRGARCRVQVTTKSVSTAVSTRTVARVYDENSNPRHLAPVSPEAAEEYESNLQALQRESARLGKKVGVFNHGGWALIERELVSYWQTIDEHIRSRKAARIEDVEFLRGQLVGLEFILSLKNRTVERHEVVKKALEQHRQQAEAQ